jgi:hypothetical protein
MPWRLTCLQKVNKKTMLSIFKIFDWHGDKIKPVSCHFEIWHNCTPYFSKNIIDYKVRSLFPKTMSTGVVVNCWFGYFFIPILFLFFFLLLLSLRVDIQCWSRVFSVHENTPGFNAGKTQLTTLILYHYAVFETNCILYWWWWTLKSNQRS